MHISGQRGGVGVAGGVGEEGGGEQEEWGERRRRQCEGEERRTLFCLLFLGGGGGEALAYSPPLEKREGWIWIRMEIKRWKEGYLGGNKRINKADDASEKDAAWSFVSWRRRQRNPGLLLSCIFRRLCWT